MNWYTHYIGDYLKDTMHLSLTEEGVYRRLLDNYYATEKPIPSDLQQVFNICRTKTATDRRAVSTVLSQFFSEMEDGFFHGRVERELNRSKYISDKRSKAGAWKRNKCSTNAPTNEPTNEQQNDNTCSTISLSLSKSLSKPKTLEPGAHSKKATRLPEDFVPKQQHYEIAKELGVNCELEFQKFRDHFLGVSGSAGLKLDWDATFRKWLRNSVNYGGHRAARQQISKAAERQQRNREILLRGIAGNADPDAGSGSVDDGKGVHGGGGPALEGAVRKVSAAGN